jgi:endonuclease/exonuclease/phosphatase family metal-dependent hydrolase
MIFASKLYGVRLHRKTRSSDTTARRGGAWVVWVVLGNIAGLSYGGCADDTTAPIRTAGNNRVTSSPIAGPTGRTTTGTTASAAADDSILRAGVSIGVVSFNLDYRCSMVGGSYADSSGCSRSGNFKQAIQQSIAAGESWDIIGFQEMRTPINTGNDVETNTDLDDFVNIMRELGKEYHCVSQRERHGNFSAAVCTTFGVIDSTYVEHVISPGRVVQCVQIETPAGVVVACNTHVQAKEDTVAQFRDLTNYIMNGLPEAYKPAGLDAQATEAFKLSLRARTVLAGDMNVSPDRIVGQFQPACDRSNQGRACGIDQVMYLDMTRADVGGTAPMNELFLQPERGFKDSQNPWPSDHDGPIVARFVTREMKP